MAANNSPAFSSEAIEVGIKPPENATPEELEAWRNSLDPDTMGFYGINEGGGEDGV